MTLITVMFIICTTLITCPQAGAFDFYQLVQQYQPVFCEQDSCTVTPLRVFTIHGLWPSKYTGRDPVGTSSSANKNSLKTMKAQLAPIWPNLKGDDVEFWAYEWDKHGSESQLTQDAYFQKCISLSKDNNVTSLLAKAGIRPEQKLRTAEELEKAINGTTKKQPTLKCYNDGNVQKLREVVLCFDKAGASRVDCPLRPGATSICPKNGIHY